MLQRVARWSVAHRRRVMIGWVAIAVLTTVVAGSVGLILVVVGVALLVATTAIYFLGRNRIRASSEGFSSAQGHGAE